MYVLVCVYYVFMYDVFVNLCVLRCGLILFFCCVVFFCQAEDGIRYLVRSRGLGDVYKRQVENLAPFLPNGFSVFN